MFLKNTKILTRGIFSESYILVKIYYNYKAVSNPDCNSVSLEEMSGNSLFIAVHED